LGPQFPADFREDGWVEKIPPAGAHRVGGKTALRVHQTRDGWGRQNGAPLNQGEVHPETQAGKVPGEGDGLGKSGPARHEAGVAQNPKLVGQGHRLVQEGGQTEIVGGEQNPAGSMDRLRLCKQFFFNLFWFPSGNSRTVLSPETMPGSVGGPLRPPFRCAVRTLHFLTAGGAALSRHALF
jgi:hypothetical protein